MSNNKALIHRWFEEVWNNGRAEAIGEMMGEHCVAHGLADAEGKDIQGPPHSKFSTRHFGALFLILKS